MAVETMPTTKLPDLVPNRVGQQADAALRFFAELPQLVQALRIACKFQARGLGVEHDRRHATFDVRIGQVVKECHTSKPVSHHAYKVQDEVVPYLFRELR